MSFLAPIYALAAVAIALPIFFHLVRKRPKELKKFSSLMFLEPAPPRLTSQSRIDQWLLLLLRSLAIGLLAFAFARPYWNSPAEIDRSSVGTRKMILIDSSGSMRRKGLWEKATLQAEKLIRDASPSESISVYQFDRELKALVSVDDAAAAIPDQRKQLALSGLRSAKVSWNETDLGKALCNAADLLVSDRDGVDESEVVSSEIRVVTDFQVGSRFEKLAGFNWPKGCKVQVEQVQPESTKNCFATITKWQEDELIAPLEEQKRIGESKPPLPELRVRVSNQSKEISKVQLTWLDRDGKSLSANPISCVAPSHGSVAVRVPQVDNGSVLQLSGDTDDFDNLVFVAKQVPQQLSVVCIDKELESAESSLIYFVRRMPFSRPGQTVELVQREPGDTADWPSPKATPLIVASHYATETDCAELAKFAKNGGGVLFVMDADSDTYRNQLRNLDEDELTAITDVRSKGYAMLEKIDFRHPIFVDFASSKFNDFTKIRFWKHRRVDISNSSEWRILAGFDDGAPALLERSIGSGRLWLMTAGWQPTESQLALSSKFVPLMASLFGLASPPIQLNQALTVGDRIPVDEADKVLGPDGIERSLNEPASEGGYATQEPGFFLRRSLSGSESIFAVNLAESECQTEVGDLVKLERFGVTMSTQQSELRTEKNQRQLRSAELESQQSWWRWAVLGILGAAGIESILCVKRNNSK